MLGKLTTETMTDRDPTNGLENMTQKLKQTPEELVGVRDGLTRLAFAPLLVILPSPMYR